MPLPRPVAKIADTLVALAATLALLAAAGCASPPPVAPSSDRPALSPSPSPPSAAAPAPPAGPTPPTAAPPPPAPSATAAPPAPPPYGAAVAARFPDPPVSYATPGLRDGRTTYTTNDELRAALRALVRPGEAAGLPSVALLTLGSSQRGVPIDALVFGKVDGAQRVARPTVLLIGQQHGDEPAGAEALLVIAQELASGALQPLLDRINVIVLPRANPDGAAAGERATANGVDLNRDHLHLRTPEAQALAQLLRESQPAVVVDAHEYTVVGPYPQKFGAVQRYDALVQTAMTPNLAPFVSKAADEWFREPLVEALKQQGLSSQWYYTTSDEPQDRKLQMGGIHADNARNVAGLMNAASLLVETRGAGIGRLHLKRRVHTQVTALRSVLASAHAHAADLLKLRQFVDGDVALQACRGEVVVEAGYTPSEYTVTMLDPASGTDKALTLAWDSALELQTVKARARPCGYWLAADQLDAVARLRSLGVQVRRIAEVGVARGETYSETSREEAARPGGGSTLRLQVQTVPALIDVPAGSFYVPLDQPLANLVVAALEPDAPGSYLSQRIVVDLAAQVRVLARPELKSVPVP